MTKTAANSSTSYATETSTDTGETMENGSPCELPFLY